MGSEAAACKTPPKQRINASKRLLETPPGSSPCRKSVRANSAKASRNSLFARTAEQSQQALKECIDSNLNIDDLPTDGTLQVKVVIVDSTGKPTTRIPQEEESKQIVRQLCNKNWQATANTTRTLIKSKDVYLQGLACFIMKSLGLFTVKIVASGVNNIKCDFKAAIKLTSAPSKFLLYDFRLQYTQPYFREITNLSFLELRESAYPWRLQLKHK